MELVFTVSTAFHCSPQMFFPFSTQSSPPIFVYRINTSVGKIKKVTKSQQFQYYFLILLAKDFFSELRTGKGKS